MFSDVQWFKTIAGEEGLWLLTEKEQLIQTEFVCILAVFNDTAAWELLDTAGTNPEDVSSYCSDRQDKTRAVAF